MLESLPVLLCEGVVCQGMSVHSKYLQNKETKSIEQESWKGLKSLWKALQLKWL